MRKVNLAIVLIALAAPATGRAAEIKLGNGKTVSGTIVGSVLFRTPVEPPQEGFGYAVVAGSDIEAIDERGARLSSTAGVSLLFVEGEDLGANLNPLGVAYRFASRFASLGAGAGGRIQAGRGCCLVASTLGASVKLPRESLLGEFRAESAEVVLVPNLTVRGAAAVTVPIADIAIEKEGSP